MAYYVKNNRPSPLKRQIVFFGVMRLEQSRGFCIIKHWRCNVFISQHFTTLPMWGRVYHANSSQRRETSHAVRNQQMTLQETWCVVRTQYRILEETSCAVRTQHMTLDLCSQVPQAGSERIAFNTRVLLPSSTPYDLDPHQLCLVLCIP